MKRTAVVLAAAGLLAAMAWGAGAVSAGLGVGVDPTGLWIVNAMTETPLSPSFDLRAEVGFAMSEDLSGLMLATTSVLFHVPTPPIDPFAGLGVGAALTPPPYTSGIVFELVGGVRVVPFEPVGLFAQARYLVRWSTSGWTTGPVYEAGLFIQF